MGRRGGALTRANDSFSPICKAVKPEYMMSVLRRDRHPTGGPPSVLRGASSPDPPVADLCHEPILRRASITHLKALAGMMLLKC